MFYQEPYHSNTNYFEAFKANLKVRMSHNGGVGYHPILAENALLAIRLTMTIKENFSVHPPGGKDINFKCDFGYSEGIP